MVDAVGSADLVTVGPDGDLVSTLLPVLWDRRTGDVGPARLGRLVAHAAVLNDQWRDAASGARVLAIVRGPQAYVSPSWYATKATHGRVVPTWNYSAVHLSGVLEMVDATDALRDMVGRLTDRHESGRPAPWAVKDAPSAYITGQLKAIRGIVVHLDGVEAKAKLSQNRSTADRAGVVAGLRCEGQGGGQGAVVADAMALTLGEDHEG